jgi:hypothetical protein
MADVVLHQILHTAGKEPLSTTNGALHTQVKGTDGLTAKTLKTDTDGKLVLSPDSGLATEATLAAINTALDTLNSNVSTEAKLEAIRVLLATTQVNASDIFLAIRARDWAKDTTLALVKAELEELKANQLSGEQKVQLTGNIASDSGLAANRPDAASVRAGFVYYSVDTDVIEYSDGAKWVVM